jgi:hypothetical protein
MQQNADRLIAKLGTAAVQGEEVDMCPQMQEMALSIIGASAFGWVSL